MGKFIVQVGSKSARFRQYFAMIMTVCQRTLGPWFKIPSLFLAGLKMRPINGVEFAATFDMDINQCLRILEIEGNLDPDRIHRSYRRLVKRWHPDQFAHQRAIHAQAEERLKEINQAYLFLKNHLKNNHRCKPTASAKKPSAASQRPTTQKQTPAGASPGLWSWLRRMGRIVYKQAHTGPHTSKPQASARPRPKGPKPSFEHILKEAGQSPSYAKMKKSRGARPLFNPYLRKRQRRRIYVEGTDPVSPVAPIRPVSRIRGIGESD